MTATDTVSRPPRDRSESSELAIWLMPLARRWRLLLSAGVVGAAVGAVASFAITPVYTARTVFLPPQPQQSSAASALASLGAIGIGGLAPALRTPADQYISLMASDSVRDRLVDAFDLMKLYDVKYRIEARRELELNSRLSVGKKDGLVTVEVDDVSPERAAQLANRHVDELRRLTGTLLLTEAQQRRAFFDGQLKLTRDSLAAAQQALQSSGFSAGALRAEPRTASESYGKLKAGITANEIQLRSMRLTMADGSLEIRQQLATLAEMRQQLARMEQSPSEFGAGSADYISRYREFKYQEALFEMLSRQYEAARLDESQDGALIQVIDVASVPEKRSRPRRSAIALATGFASILLAASVTLVRARRIQL